VGKPVLIGNFLHRIKRPVELHPSESYKLVTIKLKHNGVVLRHEKLGSEIKSKMFEVKEGDFILSGIDARNGAFGIVPKNLDGAIVTNDFWYFNIDESIVDKHFFLELTTTLWFDEICRKGSDGTTQRIRLQKNKFFNQEIFLPELDEQREFIEIFRRQKKVNGDLSTELTSQQTLLKKLRQQILQEAIEGKLTANWREQNSDIESSEQLLTRIDAKREGWLEEKKEDGYSEAKVIERKLKAMRNNYPNLPEDAVPSHWQWAPLLAVMNLIVDCHNKTAPYEPTGIKLLRTTNIRNGKVILAGCKYVTEETYKYWSKRCVPLDGDILYTREAPVGEVAIIPKGAKLCMGQRMMLLRPFHELIDNQFILYALMAPDFLMRLEGAQKGAMVKHLRVGDVESAMIALPPILEQKAIVTKIASLFAICDQLETQIANNKTHAEQLMQSVLKEAFQQTKGIEVVQ